MQERKPGASGRRAGKVRALDVQILPTAEKSKDGNLQGRARCGKFRSLRFFLSSGCHTRGFSKVPKIKTWAKLKAHREKKYPRKNQACRGLLRHKLKKGGFLGSAGAGRVCEKTTRYTLKIFTTSHGKNGVIDNKNTAILGKSKASLITKWKIFREKNYVIDNTSGKKVGEKWRQ